MTAGARYIVRELIVGLVGILAMSAEQSHVAGAAMPTGKRSR